MNNLFRYFLAVFLITIGVMLVMANVGVVSFNLNLAWQYIYPIFFVVIGINWLFGFFRKRGGSWEMGSFLLLFGSLLLMDRMDWIVFTFWDIFKLWPLLIVYIGFNLFRRERFTGEYGSGKEWKKGDFSMFTVGDHEYSEPNWKVEPMILKHMAGDFYFDFTKAFIPEKNIPISVRSLAGDVTILVPENLDFRIKAFVNAGEIKVLGQNAEGINRSINFQTGNYEVAERKLDFMINLKAGSIRIDQV